ncbi:MAG: ABC transporter ATP-binding protein [Anaerolineaceae bacterium]|nr:ABC transporter ATP-binding protein [Anaerolineaceae bacterium]
MSNGSPLVVCDNLVKIYKVIEAPGLHAAGQSLEVVALQGLDLAVDDGEMLGIVGSSGSGKSTLLNILGGLDRPSAGRVTVGGQDLLKLADRALDRYRRREVGFVWQQVARNLIPYLTARENVELPMTVVGLGWGEKRRRSRELLEQVGLWEHRHHRLAQLSGGQQQRVAIAVALANHPRLLLADEPTGEVDSATAQGLWDLFRELNRTQGLTTIIVTHDREIARRVDRVVAIRDGRTSTETVRVERSAEAEAAGQDAGAAESLSEYIVLDSAGRLQVPREYLEQYNVGDRVTLEPAAEGILIRPVASRRANDGQARPEVETVPAPGTGRLRGWLARARGRGRKERGK